MQATNELTAFAAAFNQTNRIVHETETNCVLEVGPDRLHRFLKQTAAVLIDALNDLLKR